MRLKAAENALNEGRIDKAYRAALESDLAEHRRGQKLRDDLARPLLARARLHAQAGRYRAALNDLDKLRAIGRGGADEHTLRHRVTEELQRTREQQAERDEAYARAADDLNAGRLASARLEIDRVEDSRHREQLREELDVRAERSAQLLEQARAALEAGDVAAALRYWEETCQRHGRSHETDTFARKLVPACRNALEDWFERGQLERFDALWSNAARLREIDPSFQGFERTAQLCARAAAHLASGDRDELRETLLRLRAARGEVRWLNEALEAVKALIESHDRLLSSPLGLLGFSLHKSPGIGTAAAAQAAHNVPERINPPRNRAVARRDPLLMLVDGTGSSLLVTGDVVRIGRAGGDAEIDVPVPGDIHSHHADIIRHGEDYFFMAHGPAQVNRREVQRALLRNGDRITLAPKVKLVFQKPSGKSDSAVLKLSDRCRLPQDVSNVVLFVDTCLIGPQASCHVRTREGQSRLVLFDRDGELLARMANADGSGVGSAESVALGQTREYGDLRVTVKAYRVTDAGGLA
ncbi:MAG: hypothetical protein KKB50_01165 [Planctomycetes bacterium]|nr:hypothetical protein [Planctomycetota bacterium]